VQVLMPIPKPTGFTGADPYKMLVTSLQISQYMNMSEAAASELYISIIQYLM